MPPRKGMAVPEGNGPVPHHDEFGSREPIMAGLYRLFEEQIDRMDKNMDGMSERLRC